MTDRPHRYLVRSSDDRALAAALIADPSTVRRSRWTCAEGALRIQAVDFGRLHRPAAEGRPGARHPAAHGLAVRRVPRVRLLVSGRGVTTDCPSHGRPRSQACTTPQSPGSPTGPCSAAAGPSSSVALPALLIVISVAVRALAGADDHGRQQTCSAGSRSPRWCRSSASSRAPARSARRSTTARWCTCCPSRSSGRTIIFTKLIVAIAVTMAFSAVPTLHRRAASSTATASRSPSPTPSAALVASIAYAALFLLLGTVTRHAVVFGLVYALVWEALFGSLVPGARTLSVQQWALAVAQKVAGGDLVTSDVGLTDRDGAAGRGHGRGHLVRGPEAAHAEAGRRGVARRPARGPGGSPCPGDLTAGSRCRERLRRRRGHGRQGRRAGRRRDP